MSTINGTVKFFNTRKGFGFIEGEDNKDIFALLKNQLNGGGKVEMDLVEQKQEATKKKTKK